MRSGLPERGSGLPERALQVALADLNRRERTVAEVRARLQRAGVGAAEADTAVAVLTELGYLDDARYARLFVEDKRELEGWGRERIARTLRVRGVEAELIEATLAAPSNGSGDRAGGADAGELERAREQLVRRYRHPASDRRDRERAFAMLVRKGYEPELAGDAVRAWAAGE